MKIPFELVGGIIMLDVSVNGKDGKMAFDTGAMQTCFNKNHFDDFEGEAKEVSKFDGEVKSETTVKGKCDIKCHEWKLAETPIILLDMNYVEKPLKGAKPDLVFLGTLGIDVIRSHTVLLDYAASQLIFDEAGLENAEEYEMNAEVLPVISVSVGEEKYKFILDTGANTCMLDDSFRQKSFTALNEAAGVVQIPSVSALGGEYSNIMAVITNMAAIKAKVDVSGVIGYQVLKDCTSYFDFEAGKISICRK